MTEEIPRDEFHDTYEPIIKPEIYTRTIYKYPYLTELRDKNFETKSLTRINLSREYRERPMFVLFVDEDPKSQVYVKIWLKISEEIKDQYCDMAYCNLTFEEKVKDGFKELSKINNISHPFYWARFRRTPFALVYRDGWPQGFYNGLFYYQELITFSTQVVPDLTREIEKFQKDIPGFQTSMRKKELELLNELDRLQQQEDTVIDKEKLRKINTRDQQISHAVLFS